MSKWTITEFDVLPKDPASLPIPVGGPPVNSQGVTAAGVVTLSGATRYVRFCGDTAAHVRLGSSGASTNDAYVTAGQDYWFGTNGLTSMNFIVG